MSAPDQVDYYILFPNHHEGLRLLKAMRTSGVNCAVSPTPRAASSCCGMSLRVAPDDLPAAQQVIALSGVNTDGIVLLPRPKGSWNHTC